MASFSVFVPLLSSYLLLMLLPLEIVAQSSSSDNKIPLNDTIIAGDNTIKLWVSPLPLRDFAFGFQQIQNKDGFLLAIWYNNIPSRDVVWYAKPGGNNLVPRGTKVELTADRGLVLNDPSGKKIWRSDNITGKVAYARMNDTGNFVIYDEFDKPLWESFHNLTDTLLPTQVINRNRGLSSRHRENDFSKGRFQFRLIPDGNAMLNTINLESDFAYASYYVTNTMDAQNSSNSGYQVRFDQNGSFYVLRNNSQSQSLGRVLFPFSDYYFKVTLNFDGVLTLSYYPKRSNSSSVKWTVADIIPDDICTARFNATNLATVALGSGICGYNSICNLKDGRPHCTCPEGYILSDPNDEYGNCQANFMQACEADAQSSPEDLYDMEPMESINWPYSDYELIKPCNNFDDCRASCLQDCLCNAAVYNGGDCWKKTLPLRYGRHETDAITFLKVRKDKYRFYNTSTNIQKKENNSLVILVSTFLGGSVFVNFILIGLLCMGTFFLHHKMVIKYHWAKNDIQSSIRCFNYKELEEATNHFAEELGRGSFGIVYKGVIEKVSHHPTKVAVKKLDRVVSDKDKEFRTEVNVIAQTHHRNLVKLIGYCDEGQHRMLVYEYLSNGTLASFLFGDLKPRWNQRIQIALGIARGLVYLHEECNPQIIHCDIKPQNILLDNYYEARISDFGLSKLLGVNQSYTDTGIRGTKGYVAPEWFKTLPISVKVDVYSFGVLLLEIICCRRNVVIDIGEENPKPILTDWACDCYSEGTLEALVHNDVEALSDKLRLERFMSVAIWCIQDNVSLRPTMKNVILMLEGIIQIPTPPCLSSMY